MNIKNSIFFLGLMFLATGCEKEETKYDYPIKLFSTNFTITSGLKIYTKHGQVTDRSIISKYLAFDNNQYFYSNTDTIIQTNNADTIIFEHRDTVIFSEQGLWGKRVTKQEGRYMYFYLTDTLIGFKGQDSDLSELINQIGIYKPFYEDIEPWGDPPSFQRVFDAKIAKGTPSLLEFPLLAYKIIRNTGRSKIEISRKNYNNIFDSTVIDLLETGDTLSIQESKITFKATN